MYTEMVGTHMLVESGGATEDEVAAGPYTRSLLSST
jgi:hypothetical protein